MIWGLPAFVYFNFGFSWKDFEKGDIAAGDQVYKVCMHYIEPFRELVIAEA